MEINNSNAHLTRQLEIIPVGVLGENITIIGAGAIGSFVTLALAKMGFENLTVYDFDKIEVENLNCQFYRHSDIGQYKAVALKDLVKQFTNVDIEAKIERYESGKFNGIVIAAVDSMNARKLIWDNHKRTALATKLIIDPRMGAESALCYAMNPMSMKDIESYEKTLYSNENAVHERCTAKATTFCALALSSHVVKVVKDYVTHSTPYTRVLQWSIRDNKQECYPNKEN